MLTQREADEMAKVIEAHLWNVPSARFTMPSWASPAPAVPKPLPLKNNQKFAEK